MTTPASSAAQTARSANEKHLPMSKSERGGIVVLDFGGQYTQLIARRIREQQVFSAILPCTASLADIRAYEPAGIVLSGGPCSVYDRGRAGLRSRACCRWACRCWESATACNGSRTRWAATWSARNGASTAARNSICETVRRFLPGLPAAAEDLDEPWRSRALAAAGLPRHRRDGQRAFRGGRSGAADLRGAISSRSAAHRARHGHPAQFCFRGFATRSPTGAARRSSPKRWKPSASRWATSGPSARSAAEWIPRWPRRWCIAPSATA